MRRRRMPPPALRPDRAIFDALRRFRVARAADQLTDAIALLIDEATRCTWWCIAALDTTWEIPAGTSRLRLTLRWNATTTDPSCGGGW